MLIKGLIYFIFSILLVILVFAIIEYFSYASSSWRLFFLLSAVFTIIFIGIIYIITPILKYLNVLKRYQPIDAVKLINTSFPDNRDTLINIVELSLQDSGNQSLIHASINQKAGKTINLNFNQALSWNKAVYPLLYFSVIGLIYIIIFTKNPAIINDSVLRIVNYKQEFTKDYGYSISIIDKTLTVERGENLKIEIQIEGKAYPENLFIYYGGNQYLLNKINNNSYSYMFNSVNNSFNFRVGNDFYLSKLYEVSVLNSPVIIDYKMEIEFPDYLQGIENFQENLLSQSVPFGSKIKWVFHTEFVDTLIFIIDSIKEKIPVDDNQVMISKMTEKSFNYSIVLQNENVHKQVLGTNTIQCVFDLFPEIEISYLIDSVNPNIFYFKGIIKDDYGFNQLKFNYLGKQKFSNSIPINTGITLQEFYYQYDFSLMNDDNSRINFEIFDNDKINFYKSTHSEEVNFNKLNSQELFKNQTAFNNKMDSNILMATKKVNEILNDIDNFKNKLFNEKLSSYQKSQLMENLNQKQTELLDILNNLQKQHFQKAKMLADYIKQTEELKKLENQNSELLDQLMDEDLKTLLKELAELKSKFESNDVNKDLSDFEKQMENYKEQLERSFEVLKKQEVIKDFELLANQLRMVAKLQDSILKSKSKTLSDSLRTNSLNEMKKISEEFRNTSDKNENLTKPINMEGVKEELENLSNKLNENSDFKDSKTQESRDDLNKLADKIENNISNKQKSDNAESADKVRQLTENLLQFSYEQENINTEISKNSDFNSSNLKTQFDLTEKFKLINDSLVTIGKSTPFLSSFIFTKSNTIENKLLDIEKLWVEKNRYQVSIEQRLIIENTNDLILLLSESLKNMDSFGNSGNSSSKSKRKQKPSLSELRNSSESLKDQLQNMISKMKQSGGSMGSNSPSSIGKMLAEQEKFQQLMNQLGQSQSLSSEQMKQLSEINKLLNDNKREMLNKQITNNLLERQNKITTRLLEAERAQNEREIDEKRISNESNFKQLNSPKIKFEGENQFTNFDEILSKSTIYLNYFYKEKFQEFINKLNEQPNGKETNNTIKN